MKSKTYNQTKETLELRQKTMKTLPLFVNV